MSTGPITPPSTPQPTVTVPAPAAANSTSNVSYTTASTLPPAPNLSQVNTTAEQGYFGYGCSILYTWNKGILPLPVAAGADAVPVEMIRTNTGSGTKTITAVATRVGQLPVMPSFNTQSANEILVDMLIGGFSPEAMPDGTKIYGVIVQYVYALLQAPGPNDLLDLGATPFDAGGPGTNRLNPANFVQYLVAPASPVTPPLSGFISQ